MNMPITFTVLRVVLSTSDPLLRGKTLLGRAPDLRIHEIDRDWHGGIARKIELWVLLAVFEAAG